MYGPQHEPSAGRSKVQTKDVRGGGVFTRVVSVRLTRNSVTGDGIPIATNWVKRWDLNFSTIFFNPSGNRRNIPHVLHHDVPDCVRTTELAMKWQS